ncbi:MAG: ADP-forming succinate--CoA ligase subunit beta [Candidatus Bathyarchaeota archaeon]|nr:MAG: ADP-forming succinate--CoA ligase subunit beta [Candidatus Bathyarchaeota archaeon]
MKLFEHEAKTILAGYAIPVPKGALATSPGQAKKLASQLRPPFAVKAQVLIAGRGKAGGIQFAHTLDEAENATKKILNMEIRGLKVHKVLIEEKVQVRKELYFGITTDRSRRCYVALASASGGVDVEEIAYTTPRKMIKTLIDPTIGFRGYHAREMASKIGYSGKLMLKLAAIYEKLFKFAMENDVELVEMNPIVETSDGTFVAADARIIIDDSALYRHPQYSQRLISDQKTELTLQEIKARKAGLAYVELEGNIGIMGNGAGLVMATLDAVQLYNGSPANFLDVGGGASESQIDAALAILLADDKSSAILINILGGITRCDEVARGILATRNKVGFTKPIVIRLVGTNEDEGRRILAEAGIHVLDSMEEAAKKAVELSRG